jgi:tetratricopeptide (TPR) repeat protein
MLLQKTWNKLSKSSHSADTIFKKGLLLLQDKLYKQAMIELKIALERNPAAVKPELEKLFEKYQESDSREIALTIGLVLFQVKKEERLALKLGNFSRQLGNYKQANNLYRQALKINRSSKLAFYNLAASMGRVDWYDHDIAKLTKQFFEITAYVLPEFLNENKTIVAVINEIERQCVVQKTDAINKLNALIQAEQNVGNSSTVLQLKQDLDRLINQDTKPAYTEVLVAMQKRIRSGLQKEISQKEQEELYADIFNLGLFALKANDIDSALEYFLILKSNDLDIGELDLCLALASAMNGHMEEAIRILTDRISSDRENRLLNINLALLHKRTGNKLLSYKFQIISAALLEKSQGLIHTGELLNHADHYFRQGQLDNALRLYQIVSHESNSIKAWLNIGEIYLLQKRQLEALDTFRELRRLFPDSQEVEAKLSDVHKIICQQADELFNASKFSQSAVVYERALKLTRTPETIAKLIAAYKRLNKHHLVQKLYEEQQNLTNSRQKEGILERKQDLIEQGKRQLKNQDFESAILSFENAFAIQPDKDVFVYLAHIYKGLKRKRMLRDLVQRWRVIEKPQENART